MDQFKTKYREATKEIVYDSKENLLADEVEKFMRKVFEEIQRNLKEKGVNKEKMLQEKLESQEQEMRLKKEEFQEEKESL
jgi:DNA-binding HxlR family transcriptional regulator